MGFQQFLKLMADWNGIRKYLLVCDYISGATGSFSTAFGAHTGIGTMPITLW
jgi:hypothetical protein